MPYSPSPYAAADTTSTTSQSISDIVIDTFSSAASIAVAHHRPQPSFLFPAAPPRTSPHILPAPASRVAPRLFDPFATPNGVGAGALPAGPSASHLHRDSADSRHHHHHQHQQQQQQHQQQQQRFQGVAQAGPSRYAIPSSSSPFGAGGGPLGAAGMQERHQGISLLMTPSAPVSFSVYTTASTATGGAAVARQNGLPTLLPPSVMPPAAPRRPVAAAGVRAREQFASTPESSFGGSSSWFGHGHGLERELGPRLGYTTPSLDAAAQAEERRGARGVPADPVVFDHRVIGTASGQGAQEAASVAATAAQLLQAQRGRRVTFFPPSAPSLTYGQHGHAAAPPFETPTNQVGTGIDERGLAFAQSRPTATDASLSINTASSSSYLTNTDTHTADAEAEADGNNGEEQDEEEEYDNNGPPSPPPLMLRTWKGQTASVPRCLLQPDFEAVSQSLTATEGVLDTFLGLRAFHGWYGYSYCNPTDAGARGDRDRKTTEEGEDDVEEEEDEAEDESTINLYDAFGRVRATISTPKYHLRGGPKRPLPTPLESVAIRRKTELKAVQRRNDRVAQLDAPSSPSPHPATTTQKSTIRPWTEHRRRSTLSTSSRSKRQKRVVEDTMVGLRNALLAAEVNDWTIPPPRFQGGAGTGTIYNPEDDEVRDLVNPSSAGREGMQKNSVIALESALPGVYL